MKPALVLVDIQNDYFPDGNMELVDIDIASSNARLLSAKAIKTLMEKVLWV